MKMRLLSGLSLSLLFLVACSQDFSLSAPSVSPLAAQSKTNSVAASVDESTETRSVTFDSTDFPDGEVIEKVNVTLKFSKDDYAEEAYYILKSPGGKSVVLIEGAEGFGGSGEDASFDSDATDGEITVVVEDGAEVPVEAEAKSGTIGPKQPLSAFSGESPVGEWVLTVGDDYDDDALEHKEFTLEITTKPSDTAADSYVADFETAPLNKILYSVKVGQGVVYNGSGSANTDSVRVDGYRYLNGKRLSGNQVKVISVSGDKVLTVVKAGTNTPNPTGGELDIKPAQSFGGPSLGKNGLVTLKSITVGGINTNGAKVILYGNGKPIKTLALAKTPTQTLTLNEPNVGFIQVRANDSFTVDDVVFEVPGKEDDFIGKEIVGIWEGTADGDTWTIRLTVTKDPNANQIAAAIAYPSLDCGGTWTFNSAQGSTYNFTEQITYGTGCIVTGNASVTYNQDDSLAFLYQAGGSIYTSTLQRADE